MMSSNRHKLRIAARNGSRGAKLAAALLAQPDRLLGVVENPVRTYASAAFRTWVEHDGSDEGRSWIAGAVGSPPIITGDALLAWRHLDITDVILWDPRTNEVMVAGQCPVDSAVILPHRHCFVGQQLTVFADGAAYFQAWAAYRAARAAYRRAGGDPWSGEDAGYDLPGALIIGDIRRARWPAPRPIARRKVPIRACNAPIRRPRQMPPPRPSRAWRRAGSAHLAIGWSSPSDPRPTNAAIMMLRRAPAR